MIGVYVGIDLGSTTTKAVVLDGDGNVIGAASPTAVATTTWPR